MSSSEQTALEILAPDRGVSPSSTSNSGQVTETLKRAMERGHLVSPSTTCPNLPIGCEVAFSAVLINPNSSEVYSVGGKLGLAKPALDKIAKAVGVSWDPVLSRRLDDGSDPYFASYKAVGVYRHFDGTIMQITGEKQMDLHDDSEWAKKLTAGELSMQRKFIAEHAETKARLRAIRSLGLQTSYTKEELEKPFIVAKLMLTGRVSPEDDPTGALQKILTHNISQSMMGGQRMLYGQDAETTTPAALPPAADSGTGAPAETAVDMPIAGTEQPATSEPKHCTPDECFGKGSVHVKACSIPVNAEQQSTDSQPEAEPWTITKGPAAGQKINDEGHVTPKVLEALRDYYAIALEDKDAPEIHRAELKAESAEVEKEIKRRGLFEHASQK